MFVDTDLVDERESSLNTAIGSCKEPPANQNKSAGAFSPALFDKAEQQSRD